MGYKTKAWRDSMRVTLDYNNMTEKFLGENGDKVDAADKAKLEDEMKNAKEAMKSENIDEIILISKQDRHSFFICKTDRFDKVCFFRAVPRPFLVHIFFFIGLGVRQPFQQTVTGCKKHKNRNKKQ